MGTIQCRFGSRSIADTKKGKKIETDVEPREKLVFDIATSKKKKITTFTFTKWDFKYKSVLVFIIQCLKEKHKILGPFKISFIFVVTNGCIGEGVLRWFFYDFCKISALKEKSFI